MSRLVLHIGAEKTGTTSIQRALAKHRRLLREQDVFVSGSLGDENHKILAAYALPFGSRDVALVSQGCADDKGAYEAFRSKVADGLRREVEESDCSTFCISSEDLHRLLDPFSFKSLFELLDPLFDEIKVVLFVRRQDRLAISRYNTLVKYGFQSPFSFKDLSKKEIFRMYDYGAICSRWEQASSKTAITVVPYGEESNNRGSSSVELFRQVLGVSSLPEPASKLNSSMHAVDLRLVQVVRANRDLDPAIDPVRVVRQLPQDGEAIKLPASRADAEAFMATFAHSNANVARRFCDTDSLFSDDFSMYPENFDPEQIEKRVRRRLLLALLRGVSVRTQAD